MDKENVMYIHNGISFSHKILSFATIWMRLKDMLSEISQTEKDKYCMISLTCRIQGKRRKKKKHLIEKNIRFVVSRGGEEEEGEMEEDTKGTLSQV